MLDKKTVSVHADGTTCHLMLSRARHEQFRPPLDSFRRRGIRLKIALPSDGEQIDGNCRKRLANRIFPSVPELQSHEVGLVQFVTAVGR